MQIYDNLIAFHETFFGKCKNKQQVLRDLRKLVADDPSLAPFIFNAIEREILDSLLSNNEMPDVDEDSLESMSALALYSEYNDGCLHLISEYEQELADLLSFLDANEGLTEAVDFIIHYVLGIIRCYAYVSFDVIMENLFNFNEDIGEDFLRLIILNLLLHNNIAVTSDNGINYFILPNIIDFPSEMWPTDEPILLPHDENYIFQIGSFGLPFDAQEEDTFIDYLFNLKEEYDIDVNELINTLSAYAHAAIPFQDVYEDIYEETQIDDEYFYDLMESTYYELPCGMHNGLILKEVLEDDDFDEINENSDDLINSMLSNSCPMDEDGDFMNLFDRLCLYVSLKNNLELETNHQFFASQYLSDNPLIIDEFIEFANITDEKQLDFLNNLEAIQATTFKFINRAFFSELILQDSDNIFFVVEYYSNELFEHLNNLVPSQDYITCILLPINDKFKVIWEPSFDCLNNPF